MMRLECLSYSSPSVAVTLVSIYESYVCLFVGVCVCVCVFTGGVFAPLSVLPAKPPNTRHRKSYLMATSFDCLRSSSETLSTAIFSFIRHRPRRKLHPSGLPLSSTFRPE